MSNGIITRRLSDGGSNESKVITLLSWTSLKGSSVTVDVSDTVNSEDVKLYFVQAHEKSSVSSLWVLTPNGEQLGYLSTFYSQGVNINFTDNIFKLTWSNTGYSIAVSLFALC